MVMLSLVRTPSEQVDRGVVHLMDRPKIRGKRTRTRPKIAFYILPLTTIDLELGSF